MCFAFKGMQPATSGQRVALYVAGGFNLGAAATLVLLARAAPQWLGVDPLSGSQLAYVDLFSVLVLAFGLGYALGGRDLTRFWPYVAMGVPAKGMVVALILGNFALGRAGLLPALLACADAVFALFFLRVLHQQAK